VRGLPQGRRSGHFDRGWIMANIAYLIVSAEYGDAGSQRSLIGEFASAKNVRIDNYITVDLPSDRKERGRRVRELLAGVDRWDAFIVSDLAALGDDVSDVVSIAGNLLERGVRFMAAKQGLDLSNAGDSSSKAVTGLFAMLALLEKEVASRRIKGVLAQKRKEGVVLGRPKGSLSASKLDDRKELIIDYLSKGVSKASLARILETSPTNLASFLRTRNIVVSKQSPATRKQAPPKGAPEEEVHAKTPPPVTVPAQEVPSVQFHETTEVLLCRQCGKNIHDPRTTTCAGGYVDYPNGESHPRVPYPKDETERCPKCGVVPGGFHHEGCYMERCPKCGERLVSCGCRTRGVEDVKATGEQSRSVRYLP